jgi:hypothetical protein
MQFRQHITPLRMIGRKSGPREQILPLGINQHIRGIVGKVKVIGESCELNIMEPEPISQKPAGEVEEISHPCCKV